MSSPIIELYSPLSGQTIDLDRVPDPVFAGKMVGDGIAIDPISDTLSSPCDGKIINIHNASHALNIKTDSGLEILMHIGLDTVMLKGEGFKPLVKAGDSVKKGQPLIKFDIETVAEKARSLISMLLITNTDVCAGIEAVPGFKNAGDPILKVVPAEKKDEKAAPAASADIKYLQSEIITVLNPQGLHARPAAVLAGLAKDYEETDLQIVRGAQSANCKSVVALMSMQILRGDSVCFKAAGPEAETALKTLSKALKEGLGESVEALPAPAEEAALPPAAESELHKDDTDSLKHGLSASAGLAVGKIYRKRKKEFSVAADGKGSQSERRSLQEALDKAKEQLKALQADLQKQKNCADKAAIFAAHSEILDDPDLLQAAFELIEKGRSAAFGWQSAYKEQADRLSRLGSALLAARATDIRDVGERVLTILTGGEDKAAEYPENTILAAEDLTPSDTASLDRTKVLGFVTVLGGTTSHAAILARSLDMPALAGISPKVLETADGTPVILDGTKGLLEINPGEERIKEVSEKIKVRQARQRELLAKASLEAATSDAHKIEAAANIGSPEEAVKAVEMGCDGVGLLRSEFLFMGRSTPPSEEEQAEAYIQIAKALGTERFLIVRTLDVGGDKPLPYLPIPKEANPFLGERGLRVSLNRPELLRAQFRAILKAAPFAKVQIMLPMVTTVEEFRQAKAIFDEECEKAGTRVPLGIMIEVPAAALCSEVLAKEAEFFSIGTNDLTQYATAIDRGHPKLGVMADALHPAVLRLIKVAVHGAHKHGRKVGVCGGLGGDIQAAAVLVGLDIDELSMPAPVIPAIKERIRQLNYEECRQLALRALTCESAQEVRKLQEGVEL